MSGATWSEVRLGIWEGRFRDANEFLRALDPSSALWKDAPDDWIFRGHGDSDWFLEPKAHRAEEWKALARIGEAPFIPSATPEGVRMSKEGEVLQAFLEALEAAGIQVPFDYRMIGGVPGVGNEKPLALAQHYGLPTRLLDWTRHAAVAAYFACLRPALPAADLAVWALHGSYVSSNPTEAATCRVFQTSRYDNPNLHAQDGLFTLAGLAPGTWSRRARPAANRRYSFERRIGHTSGARRLSSDA
jgi:hypothetical protein